MIKDVQTWQAWEQVYLRQRSTNYWRNLQLFEALYEEARLLGVWPSEDRLEGVETRIKLAKALNVSGIAEKARPRS